MNFSIEEVIMFVNGDIRKVGTFEAPGANVDIVEVPSEGYAIVCRPEGRDPYWYMRGMDMNGACNEMFHLIMAQYEVQPI